MSMEGVTWMRFDVPDDVAAERGKIIAELFGLASFKQEFNLELDNDEDDTIRVTLPDGTFLSYAGVYRHLIQMIGEQGRSSVDGEGRTTRC